MTSGKTLLFSVLFSVLCVLALGAAGTAERDSRAGAPGAPAAAPSKAPAEAPAPSPAQEAAVPQGSSMQGMDGGAACCCTHGSAMGSTGMAGTDRAGASMNGTQGIGMNMAPGATIQDIVQLLTTQDLLESILTLVNVQERVLARSAAPGAEDASRELAEARNKVEMLLKENRDQLLALQQK